MTYKKWTDYTDQELVDLYTGENWEDFFEFQCALKGVPFLPKEPGPKPKEVPEKPDTTTWRVGGISFLNKEDAEEVYSLVITKTLVHDNYQSSNIRTIKVINPDNYNYPQLKHETNYSEALYEKIKPDIKAYKERKKAWEAAKENYKKVESRRDEVFSDIYEVVDNQLQLNREHSSMLSEYERYLKLAGKDAEIALNFLANSFPKYKEIFPEFFVVEKEEPVVRDS